MAEAQEAAPYQQGVLGWYCPWCNHANLTQVPGSDAHRTQVPGSLRRLEAMELSCTSCKRAVRLIEKYPDCLMTKEHKYTCIFLAPIVALYLIMFAFFPPSDLDTLNMIPKAW